MKVHFASLNLRLPPEYEYPGGKKVKVSNYQMLVVVMLSCGCTGGFHVLWSKPMVKESVLNCSPNLWDIYIYHFLSVRISAYSCHMELGGVSWPIRNRVNEVEVCIIAHLSILDWIYAPHDSPTVLLSYQYLLIRDSCVATTFRMKIKLVWLANVGTVVVDGSVFVPRLYRTNVSCLLWVHLWWRKWTNWQNC